MLAGVRVTVIEDDSVEQLIKKTARTDSKLRKKQRIKRINKSSLKERNVIKKILSIMLNTFFVTIIILALMLCFSCIVARASGTVPTFVGYSLMRISSESMEASGFYVGDNIVVKAVDTDTLRVGDNIAFYVYEESYSTFDLSSSTKLELADCEIKYNLTISNFFGFQSKEIKQAADSKCMIVFHQIVGIYEDNNGEYWFETKGTSSGGIDVYRTNEAYVVGIYDGSAFASMIASILNSLTNNFNFILLILIPFLLFCLIIVLSFAKDFRNAKLELDVVNGKRKLNDEKCIKNNIGYSMDIKTKYQVLAHASDKDKREYLALLWKGGSAPVSIQKYIIKKQLYLSSEKKFSALKEECKNQYDSGKDIDEITAYYLKEKERILKEQGEKEKRIRNLRKEV